MFRGSTPQLPLQQNTPQRKLQCTHRRLAPAAGGNGGGEVGRRGRGWRAGPDRAARKRAQPQRGEAERRVIERRHTATPSAHLFKARPPRGNAAANSAHSALIKDLLLPLFFCAFAFFFSFIFLHSIYIGGRSDKLLLAFNIPHLKLGAAAGCCL